MIFLAACDGTTIGDRVIGIGVAIALVALWLGVAWALVWLDRDREERRALLIILVVAGCAVPAALGAFSGAGLETLILPAGIATVTAGAGAGQLLRVGVLRGAGTALTGGVFFALAALVLILVYTFLGGACIGEELG